MSGIDIRGGGVVAVDTDALRAAADRYASERAELDDVCRRLRLEAARLSDLVDPTGDGAPGRGALIADHVDGVAARAAGLERRLRSLAAVYEFVELRAARAAAAAAGDEAVVERLDRTLDRLQHDDPLAGIAAAELEVAWDVRVLTTVAGPVTSGALPANAQATSILLMASLAGLGAGRVRHGERLRGSAEPVVVAPVGAVRREGAPPRSLAAALRRIPPGADGARVRVERYAMPDGSRRFAVYVAGTRSGSIDGGAEPWDMRSNLQLYAGERSSSYDATLAALRDAGARPGDAAYVFGHSQGGMIADRVAMEGGFDTRLLVTAGSPTEAQAGPDTVSVQLRHRDDPVAALAVGASPGTVGAPGSVIVERLADPLLGPQDLTLAPHHLDAYIDTARELDGSPDPRVAGLTRVLGELDAAASVEVTEYGAVRGG